MRLSPINRISKVSFGTDVKPVEPVQPIKVEESKLEKQPSNDEFVKSADDISAQDRLILEQAQKAEEWQKLINKPQKYNKGEQ